MLYVAITRCKNRLIVFDRDRERRKPIFDLMNNKKLVTSEWDGSQSFFKESTPQEWRELGCDLFAKKLVRRFPSWCLASAKWSFAYLYWMDGLFVLFC